MPADESDEIETDEQLVERCRTGDNAASRLLFDRYVGRLLGVARQRIGERMKSRFDAEDVVQSVFRTFFDRLKKDQFEINDGDDLSKLLVRITLHKTLRQVAYHRAGRRTPSMEATPTPATRDQILDVMSREPSPVTVLTFVDQLDHFLNKLDPEDREILAMRLQGQSTEEIATALGTYDRKIRRVLERVRSVIVSEQETLESFE
ncbi:RNA polymerase sigma factor [Zavarzinella formosa]|uniref:RNA polymerase sigma factor n=1 Tax=Zavarzinella formosa TaxID=360055 RepID=UPI00030EF1FC|nr:sigma-70 family RNA polymerase sigma factor [Zavarzinella formosa]